MKKNENNKEHVWESYAAGFTHESGHLNVSECTVCKVQTRKYHHGDFAEKEIAEQEVQDKYDCPGFDPHEQIYEEENEK
ncbi:MAG: hypothetical protein ACLFPH_10780, partial [Bacteroidales bacterium]